nr:MAG TPA: BppU domain protein [Caudoviricetes sp.]
MNYDIELNANDSSVLETQYAFTQGDYGQIQFSIRVKANGVYVTNAQRAYIVFTLPNGYVVTGADMAKSVATYTYPFQGSELQVPGTINADVKLVYTDGQISSNKFSFICRYDPLHDKSFNAGPYISQLQQIINEGQDKIDYLQSLIEILQIDVGGTPVMRSDLHNTRDAVASGSKAIDGNMAQNILLKSDVTHQNENDANKIVAADSLYSTKTDLQGQITLLNSNLTALSGDTYWKRINASAAQGNATVTIPANAKEIRVCITYTDQFWSKDIQTSLLTGTPQIVGVGGNYYSSTDYSSISVNAYTTGVQMRLVWINGAQQRDSSYMVVFYK